MGANIKILIVDDDVYIGDMVAAALTKQGYEPLRAYSGTEALFRYAVILAQDEITLETLDIKAVLEKLFDRFYTVQEARVSTGLGLSIARSLVEQLGGSIGAEYEDGVLRIEVKA